MANVVEIEPSKCRMWGAHDRLANEINEDNCRCEIESVLANGQMLPTLGRRLKNDSSHEVELIYGARRLFVARHLRRTILVELRELTDKEAVVALDIENRLRKELSPYERGRSYSLWLKKGLFSSQEELAEALAVSPSQVSRLLRLAQLPPLIVNAFPSPLDIRETWGRDLMDICEDSESKVALAGIARSMAKEDCNESAKAVYKRLMSAPLAGPGRLRSAQLSDRDEVVKDVDGITLFRIRSHNKDTALLLSTRLVSGSVLSEIKSEVIAILHRARSQAAERAA